ncbi:hypothetical protein LDENG_00074220 [Lucifuga dentata]|nr:hypothetical protein LDENG_00074220 [Lucifuga dentata]
MLDSRFNKISELENSVAVSQREAEKEKAHIVQQFTDLICSMKESQAKLIEVIQERHRVTKQKADDFIEELRMEIAGLESKRAQVEQLYQSKDHHGFLQSFLSLSSPLNNWKNVSVSSNLSLGSMKDALSVVKQIVNREMELIPEMKLKTLRKHAVDLTFNPDTAHRSLIISQDGKQVTHAQKRPNCPQRSELYPGVLAKEGFVTGKFYYEVQVKGKTKWVVGVVKESSDREKNYLSVIGGFWAIRLEDGIYKACGDVKITLKEKPQKMAIFVNYSKGLVSFYDVDSKSCIYSFTDQCFREKLYPYFCPGDNNEGTNSAPLIVTPAHHSN